MRNIIALCMVCIALSCGKNDVTEFEMEVSNSKMLKSTTSIPVFGSWNTNFSGYGQRSTYEYETGDFNNDGYKDDILRIGRDGNAWVNFGSDGHNDAWDQLIGNLGAEDSNEFLVAQFNGTGNSDILKIGNDGIAFYTYNVQPPITWQVASNWGDQRDVDYQSGDLNGDGYCDVFESAPNGIDQINISYNYGIDGLFDIINLQWGANTSNEFRIGDFDGDNKDDVLKVGNDGKAWINYANDGFLDNWDSQPGSWGDQRTNAFTCGDFDTDGKDDVLKIGSNGNAFINFSGDLLTDGWDLTMNSYGSQDSNDYIIGDFDRDSRPDIMKIGEDGLAWVDYAAN